MGYYSPQKAVVIAGSRVGSTMLCNALDSHPLIGCDRSEPLNYKTSPYIKAGLSVQQTLDIVLGRPGFQWCMCKVSYRHLRKLVSIQDLADLGVTKFVHLWRENALRVVVSAALNTARTNGQINHPTHAWETPPLQTITLDIDQTLASMRLYLERVERMKIALSNRETLTLTYEYLSRGTFLFDFPNAELVAFFDVPSVVLTTHTKPINPYPLSKIITNWGELYPVLLDSEFASFAESEQE